MDLLEKEDRRKKEMENSGLGMYEVICDSVSYWLIAVSPSDAFSKIKSSLEDVGCWEDSFDEGSYAEKLPTDKELTFHCDRKSIIHTVEDWLVIYEGCDTRPYLACSEF